MKILSKLAVLAAATSAAPMFLEDFAEGLEASSFAVSKHEKYNGEWAVEDGALIAKDEAKSSAVSAKFEAPLDPADKGFVVQYEVKFSQHHSCGGAYIKVLKQEDDFTPATFKDETPYVVMFGPDKCGQTDKVHFIFRHKSPKTGEFEEKHLKAPAVIKNDLLSHLYTLVVSPDNTYEIFIDQVSVNSGALLEDFEPSVNPPKEIDDPTDSKPEDWVDEDMIEDPNESKPDDWDEDAPMVLPDMDAVKPEGWDDDGVEEIPDPEAEKPDDWDDEDDGEWEAPLIDNPVCLNVGCGEWTRPTIPNPDYKGPWHHPMISNPDYIGEWAPKQIPNPNYFEDDEPHKLSVMGGVGIEIWSMQDGIQFDNVFIDTNLEAAIAYGKETWAPKNKEEVAAKKAEDAANSPSVVPEALQEQFELVKELVVANPLPALGSAVALLAALIYMCRGSSPDIEEVATEATEAPAPADEEESEGDESEEDDEPVVEQVEKRVTRASARKASKKAQ